MFYCDSFTILFAALPTYCLYISTEQVPHDTSTQCIVNLLSIGVPHDTSTQCVVNLLSIGVSHDTGWYRVLIFV